MSRPRMLALVVVPAVLLAGCHSGSKERYVEHDTKAEAALFEKLKPLAGTWEMTDEKGQKQVAIVSKVTSNGAVYSETMFPGTPHEMTNMYHMDGSSMMMTHYCAIGNQPRMRCVGQSAPNVYVFDFDSGTNIAPGQTYMGRMTLTIYDNNHIKQEWHSFNTKPSAESHDPAFDLWRKNG